MNLYNLHSEPESLLYFGEATEMVAKLFWVKYKNNPAELRKREAAIALVAFYAYLYANYLLQGPFPAGEAIISKDAKYAHWYAYDVLKGPFPAGEAVIAEDCEFSHRYAKDVLKADFYYDGKLIAQA